MSKPQTNRARDTQTGRFIYVKLKDGRTIASPKTGGKLSKAEIRTAVRAVMENREFKSAG